ncbi:MAG: imidazolonepropionase [Myxococcales bacterium]|nr:imidazolonepropionase [Polyangiaceae bacterium]MDW8251681.1 imidazolonepropionase [Myxococcales bacterium]
MHPSHLPSPIARGLIAAPRVITCDPHRPDPLGVVENGAVLIEGGHVVAVDHLHTLRSSGAPVVLHGQGVLTPGLVDAHTHAAWVGSRHDEYRIRMAGGDYEAIARAGGGIRSTMRSVREIPQKELERQLWCRLRRMLSQGVTTIEVKSGYGLDEANERKQLLAIRYAGTAPELPRVVPTYLALHAVPPEFEGQRTTYAAAVLPWLRAIAQEGLAQFVDAYVDRSAFSVDEAEPALRMARELGLGVRLHAGQFADIGACELAARVGASSADHLEHVGPAAIEALAGAGVAAVMLPVASFTLGQAPPPVGALRKAGIPLVVASDANPGTAPTESLPLAMALAARLYGLSPTECLLGATRLAAESLGLTGVAGILAPGASADLVLWELPHEDALVQPWGPPPVEAVVLRGVRVY